MKKLRDVSPIWHAVVWIVAYVLLVNLGDWGSELIGEPNAATAPLLVVLSIVLLLYVKRNGWSRYYGLRPLRRDQFGGTLLYLPLVVIAVLQYTKGYRDDLDLTAVLLIIILMVCVGFIEELVFRGFLFRGILRKSTLTRAVVISGVTFGIGHIVNLARGYTGVEQIVQIGMAVVLGVVLALLFAVSGTILPSSPFMRCSTLVAASRSRVWSPSGCCSPSPSLSARVTPSTWSWCFESAGCTPSSATQHHLRKPPGVDRPHLAGMRIRMLARRRHVDTSFSRPCTSNASVGRRTPTTRTTGSSL